MEISDYLGEEMLVKDMWKFVMEEHRAQFMHDASWDDTDAQVVCNQQGFAPTGLLLN